MLQCDRAADACGMSGGVRVVEHGADGVCQLLRGDLRSWQGFGDAEAFESGGVVELVMGVRDDEGGLCGAEGLSGAPDAAVVDVEGASRHDGGEGDVVEGLGTEGHVGRGLALGADEEEPATVEDSAGLGGVVIEVAGDVDGGGAEGEEDGGFAVIEELLDVAGEGFVLPVAIMPGEAADHTARRIARARSTKVCGPHAEVEGASAGDFVEEGCVLGEGEFAEDGAEWAVELEADGGGHEGAEEPAGDGPGVHGGGLHGREDIALGEPEHGREDDGDAGDVGLVGGPGGAGEDVVVDDDVGLDGGREIEDAGVGCAGGVLDEEIDDDLGASPRVHEVGVVAADVGEVTLVVDHAEKGDAGFFDLGLEGRCGEEGGVVPSLAEGAGDGDEGIDVAVTAGRGEEHTHGGLLSGCVILCDERHASGR